MSDDPYAELARALDEDGDPGLELLKGLYPSVVALIAERDRLRAVVEAAQTGLVLVASVTDIGVAHGYANAALEAVDQLDVSGITGDGSEAESDGDAQGAGRVHVRGGGDRGDVAGPLPGHVHDLPEVAGTVAPPTPVGDAGHQDEGRHVTKTGKVLTDADIQALADEAERGYDVSHLSPQTPEQVAEVRARRARDAGHQDEGDIDEAIVRHVEQVWRYINELSDELTGTDFNVIRGWLDGTVRPALFPLGAPDDAGQDEDHGPVADAVRSHYVSTYCIHANHAECRLTCKTCDALCRCPCHQDEEGEGPPIELAGVDLPPAGAIHVATLNADGTWGLEFHDTLDAALDQAHADLQAGAGAVNIVPHHQLAGAVAAADPDLDERASDEQVARARQILRPLVEGHRDEGEHR